jgi:hypothetical protein
MSFAHPWALLLLLLLIPVGLLYWLRLRVPRVVVGTGPFWQKALAEEPYRAWWQRWRTSVSLVLHSLTVVLLALAAAGPEIPPAQRIVLILDNSATMRATDVRPSRFDAAKAEAKRMIESLRWCDEMAIVTTSPNPVEVQPLTRDHALLGTAVNSAQAQAEPPAIEWAVKVARKIGAPDEDRLEPGLRALAPPRIVLITDGCAREAAREAQKNGVDILRVGTAAGNRAITCFTARRNKIDPTLCEVFVEVQNHGDQTAQGNLELSVDDKLNQSAALSVVRQPIFRVKLPAAARLTARITPGDDYPFDDIAELRVPAPPKQHNVSGTLRVPLPIGTRSVPDTLPGAIRAFDGNAPEKLPPGPLLIFKPGRCDLWQLGEAIADPLVTHVEGTSPVTAGVKLFDAYLPESRELKLADSIRGVARPILWAGKTPLGYAIDRPQGRVVVVCGNLATSNLPMQADFPRLVAQGLYWLDGQEPWNDIVRIPPIPPLGPSEGGVAAIYRSILLARSHPKEGSLLNFSYAEFLGPLYGEPNGIDIRVTDNIGIDASALHYAPPRLPLGIPLAVAAALLVILEFCLYQRRWTS